MSDDPDHCTCVCGCQLPTRGAMICVWCWQHDDREPDAVRALREAVQFVADGFPVVASHVQDRLDIVQAEINRLRPERPAEPDLVPNHAPVTVMATGSSITAEGRLVVRHSDMNPAVLLDGPWPHETEKFAALAERPAEPEREALREAFHAGRRGSEEPSAYDEAEGDEAFEAWMRETQR